MRITLTPDIEQAVNEYARIQGTTPELLVLGTLRSIFLLTDKSVVTEQCETLADMLHEHIGVLHSSERIPGGARMSEDCGTKFTKGLVRKREQGKI
ncbi:Uncharacterized protein dnm_094070 [Desulfonema magnum]|uniref:Uncharacterized protein n=2 Tax=Desulfonema magnum TaxID=45655 RepID=A0A975BX81_9BACT|nr:Uncharacterized protein dnm_094070 [Desulfonema magnum]